MRKIKFRGKRVYDSKWIYGYYLPWHAVTDLVGNEPYAQIFEEYKKNGKYIAKGWAKVFANSVSEFTGLTDKNGKEIYEGDIVKLTEGLYGYKSTYNTYITKVEYQVEKCGMVQFNPFNTSDMIECEVIGNIYDNIELLKGDKE